METKSNLAVTFGGKICYPEEYPDSTQKQNCENQGFQKKIFFEKIIKQRHISETDKI